MALATLSVDLVAHLAKFEGDMGKAARATEKASQSIVSSFGVVKAGLAGLAAGVTLGALVDMTKNVINSVDALNDLKDATGASIENISALEDVAARTGANFDTVQASLIKFNGALKDAKPGSDQEAAFNALNLSVKELQSLDPAEAMLRTATALSGFADDANKARLTQELFGKSLKDVAPFLKDLAEQGKLVATVTTEQAEQAERFNKSLFELQKNSQDAARRITGDLVPALNEILALYNQQGLGAAVDAIGNKLFDWEGSQSRKIINNIKSDLASLKEQSSLVTVDIFGAKGKLAKEIEVKTAELAAAEAAYYKLTNGRVGGGRGSVNPALVDVRASVGGLPDKDKPKRAGKNPDADFEAYIKRLDQQITKTIELSAYEQLLFDVKSKQLTLKPAQMQELALRAQIIDEMKAEEAAAKAVDVAKRSAADYIAGLAKESQGMEEANKKMAEYVQEIGKTTVELNALTLARMDTAIAAAEQARAEINLQNSSEAEIAAMERKIELLKEQRKITANGQIAQASSDSRAEQTKASTDFANTLQTDLKGAFSAAFRDTSGEPLKAFGDAIANVMYSRAATALADSLFSSTASSGSSSVLAALLSFDGGGYTGTGARAGGIDGKGGFMAMLHPNETVLDHSKGQGTGQAITVVQNFTVGDVASVSLVRQAVAGSERRIAAAMGRSMNYGGALA